MRSSINVMVTSCGRRVELVKAFVKAREELGISGKVIGADMSMNAPALYFCDGKVKVPKLSDSQYIQCLVDACNANDIHLIVPTIDTELQLLADSRKYIESTTNAKVLISSSKVVEICNNKILTAEFFQENGFSIPNTLTVQDISEGNYTFPLFIKPLNGSSSVNAFKVNNQRELDFFYQYIEEPIVQECVSGIEYTVDVFVDFEGNILTVVPRRRLATRAGEILKGCIDMNREIIDNVTRMISILQPIGHITVQGFYGEDGEFRYIEINPRFGGGAPMSIMAGANSCRFLYQLLNGETVNTQEICIRDQVVFSRFDDCIEVK